jgi:hypothetical protein
MGPLHDMVTLFLSPSLDRITWGASLELAALIRSTLTNGDLLLPCQKNDAIADMGRHLLRTRKTLRLSPRTFSSRPRSLGLTLWVFSFKLPLQW